MWGYDDRKHAADPGKREVPGLDGAPVTKVNGKVAVVTGAGSGIGRALGYELARRGARLALSDIHSDGLSETARHARTIGATVHEQQLDVADRDAMLAYAELVVAEFGVVQLVVNNAGIGFTGDVAEMSFAEIERVIDVDFWGVVNGTKAFLPHLIASGDGHLVNVSSVFGLFAVPGQSAYNAAKFAVRGFTEALRQEMLVSGHPVRVSCVHPGGIRTPIARNAGAVAGLDRDVLARFFDEKLAKTSADAAARSILRAVTRNRPRALVGLDAKVLDVLIRILGSRYQRLLALGVGRLLAGGQGDTAPATSTTSGASPANLTA
jgi:NAD(P)-dependent dehydrogenase (short-subunit alcohol dehydrogenase family)